MDALLHLVLKGVFVVKTCHWVDAVSFPKLGDNPGEQGGLPRFVPLQVSPAAQPDPFALLVDRPVFHTVDIGAPVGDFLVGLQESLLVVLVDLGPPDGGSVFHHFTRQTEFFHHSFGIAEGTGLHIAHVNIIVGALHQRMIQPVLVVDKGLFLFSCLFSQPQGLFLGQFNVKPALLLVHFFVRLGEHLFDGD